MLSISFLYFLATTDLFSFMVGVNSPVSTEKSFGKMVHFLMVAALETAFLFAYFIPASICCLITAHFIAYSIFVAEDPMLLRSLIVSGISS